jgi:EAL domain-containing protein (putative c-di-GMP-specific phosphodiesterase class I)
LWAGRAHSKIAPDRIELEPTESVLLEATKHHRDIIRRLPVIELRLAIDDFGAGYSPATVFPVQYNDLTPPEWPTG